MTHSSLSVSSRCYPIVDGVILLDECPVSDTTQRGTQDDVRRSFSEEWGAFGDILPEHDDEFSGYFDLVPLRSLSGKTVMDIGCGSGRWSRIIASKCDVVVLIDFSDAIFVAKRNLGDTSNAIFFRGNLNDLPFVNDCADFLFCLGVLHHLELNCLEATRRTMRLSRNGLFYLYYALDNRPPYYSPLLKVVTVTRQACTRVRSRRVRLWLSRLIALTVYKPLVVLGSVLSTANVELDVPLHAGYKNKSLRRIEQDVYDRFFTSIEQRVTRSQIFHELSTEFEIEISNREPYWHFTLQRRSQKRSHSDDAARGIMEDQTDS